MRDLTAQGMKVVVTRDPPYYLSPWDQFHEFFERGESVTHLSEAFLLLTARLDNYERVILPAIQGGAVVVSDRYTDSWLAYQSIRLSSYFGDAFKAIEYLIALQDTLIMAGLLALPSLTLWISEDPDVAIGRAATAVKISKYENLPLQQQVHRQYEYLHRRYPDRIKAVDVRGLDIHNSYRKALDIVTDHFSR